MSHVEQSKSDASLLQRGGCSVRSPQVQEAQRCFVPTRVSLQSAETSLSATDCRASGSRA